MEKNCYEKTKAQNQNETPTNQTHTHTHTKQDTSVYKTHTTTIAVVLLLLHLLSVLITQAFFNDDDENRSYRCCCSTTTMMSPWSPTDRRSPKLPQSSSPSSSPLAHALAAQAHPHHESKDRKRRPVFIHLD
jgi:hypothetical protein